MVNNSALNLVRIFILQQPSKQDSYVNGVPSCDVDKVDGVEYVTDDDQGARKFYVQLLCAKSRVTPLLGLTIPRAELCGVVLASRLSLSVAKTLSSDELMK